MADALVSALVTTVLGNLNSAALQQMGLAWGVNDELNNLESILSTIHLVLEDAEQKQRKSKVLQDWLQKLKITAYDAEIILDQVMIEGIRRNSNRGMRSYFSRRNPLLFRLKLASKVKSIRQRLDAIAAERLKFHLAEGVMDNGVGGAVDERRLTSSMVNEGEIFGRKEEKEIIIEKLIGSNVRGHDISVYAMWGMGGLGKTTLAQLIFNDERIESHFDLRIWVCVSDNFSIQRLVNAIIESINNGGCNISELETLQRCLQEKLRGKRFFLVLDDVWNENDTLWDGLKDVLRCGLEGSVIMVTTRIEKVAHMMATIPIHRLGYLSEEDCWSLFKQRAFRAEEAKENLIPIGKAIVEKCGGVPLAVKALGSLMQFKSTEREWLAIKASEIWLLSDGNDHILPALRLSYCNLPPHMRQCFTYCCVFPKGYVMEENQLIELWMANGFLSLEGQTDLHLTGHLIFKELVWRSFFHDVKKNSEGGMTCKMHDLMHYLAESVMGHETYVVEQYKDMKIPKMLRHLSFDVTSYWGERNEFKLPLIDSNSLRCIIAHQGPCPFDQEAFYSFLSKQHYLRVLHLKLFSIEMMPPTLELPKLISKLEHLRYLAMSCYGRGSLPESMTCLHYLQTLKLSESEGLVELPKGMKHMKNLWFVDIERHDSLVCTPPGLGELTLLQRLNIFIVGQDADTRIDQLKNLNLGGKLSIQGLDNVRNFEDARSANLVSKTNLTCLSLSWTMSIKDKPAEHFEEILEGLQPYQNLEKIYIRSYQGTRFPDWISSLACKNITEIHLECCLRCERLPPVGKLPFLKHLKLCKMDSIRHLNADWHGTGETSFLALTELTIDGMPNLEEWTTPDLVESFLCLKTLEIIRCPKLIGLPSLPALRDLKIKESSVTLLRSVMLFTSLTSLCLLDFPELDVLPRGLLQNHETLQILEIDGFPNIRTLSDVLDNKSYLRKLFLKRCSNVEFLPEGLEHLNSLEYLMLRECDSLLSFPATILQDLSSLRTLEIIECKRMNPLSGPLQGEPTLEYLLIQGCPEFKSFPQSMQKLTALRDLVIIWCEELCCLPNWLGHLKSLSAMQIFDCKQLKSLPDGFQCLELLKELYIGDCNPKLKKRCKKPGGEDWPKISHIPKVYIY